MASLLNEGDGKWELGSQMLNGCQITVRQTFVIHCKYNEEPQLGEYKRSHWPCGEWIAKGKAGVPIRRQP